MNSRGSAPRASAFVALDSRDFRLLLLGSLGMNLVMPLQFLTQIFWVQEYYSARAVLWVGLIAASRGLSSLIFSLVGGAFADRYERRYVLLVCQVASLAINGVVAALMLTRPFGELTMAPLLACTFVSAAVMSFDMPARTASIPTIVGMDRLAGAISLNTMVAQLAVPLTLPLVGILNDRFDAGQVYAGSLGMWVATLPLVAALRYRSTGGAVRRGMLGDISQGIRYVAAHEAILGVILLVLVMQTIGMPGVATLGPVWMTKVLGLSKMEFGFMAMTWGLGGLASSVFWVKRPDLTGRGATLCTATLLFAVSVIVFGHSRIIAVTAVANFALGVAMVATLVSSSTITQRLVDEHVRGRVMGLFPLAMGLATLSAAPVSAVAQATSLELVVPVLGWATLVCCLTVIAWRPAIRRIGPGRLSPVPAAGLSPGTGLAGGDEDRAAAPAVGIP